MSAFNPEIFANNPDVERVVVHSHRFVKLFPYFGGRSVCLAYPGRIEKEDRTPPPTMHLIALMCRKAGLSGSVALRPYFHLTQEERRNGKIVSHQAAIMSAGTAKEFPMRNKEWVPGRFQEVVRALRGQFCFVHLGSVDDPPLDGVIDMRGKTTLRQAAAVLANSSTFVGQVGFLMHLARAVDCPGVVVYGGREAPWQSGYVANENLYTPLPCAPCWYWNSCDYNRECMRLITSEAVVKAVLRQAARAGTDLPVDYAKISADLL